jgi:hypothetical protein
MKKLLHDSNEKSLAAATAEEFRELRRNQMQWSELCEKHNVKLSGFIEVAQLAAEINSRLSRSCNIPINNPDMDEMYTPERYDELKRCILNGSVNRVFQCEKGGGLRDLMRDFGDQKRNNGKPFNGYEIAESSIVKPADGILVTGNLREVMPKPKLEKPVNGHTRGEGKNGKKTADDEPMLVLGNVTSIPSAVFAAWARSRAERFTSVVGDVCVSKDKEILTARYAEKAEFELYLTQEAAVDAGHLVAESGIYDVVPRETNWTQRGSRRGRNKSGSDPAAL